MTPSTAVMLYSSLIATSPGKHDTVELAVGISDKPKERVDVFPIIE